MGKTRKERLQEYGRGVRDQVRRVLRRETAPLAAGKALLDDTRRLAKRLYRGEETKERKRAKQYLHQGVEAYNVRNYERAQTLFDKALYADEQFGLAWAYLGNANYKLGHLTEAVRAWHKAMEVEPHSKGAEMAREKLLKVGHGKEGVVETVKEQMRNR